MSKKVTIENGRYEVGGGLGSWAESSERGVPVGTVRLIGGVLMSAWIVRGDKWFEAPAVLWTPVDSTRNNPEELRRWEAGL